MLNVFAAGRKGYCGGGVWCFKGMNIFVFCSTEGPMKCGPGVM